MVKISVITVCRNSQDTIKDTISSVNQQTYVDVEHVVVDGHSSDNTMAIVRASPSITNYVSEPDNGIYDAMNKGIAMATGDIIGILNADDFYIDDTVLCDVQKVFMDDSVDACFADLVYVSQDNTDNVVRYWKSQNYKSDLFKTGWMPAHPTFFVRKRVYEKYGVFDLSYKIAADFELLFRFIEKNKIRTMYLQRVIIKMRLGGTTNKSLSNILTQNREIVSMLRTHYDDFSVIQFAFVKLTNRLAQFFFRAKTSHLIK